MCSKGLASPTRYRCNSPDTVRSTGFDAEVQGALACYSILCKSTINKIAHPIATAIMALNDKVKCIRKV